MIAPAHPEFSWTVETSRLASVTQLLLSLDLQSIVALAPIYRGVAGCAYCSRQVGDFRSHEAELAQLLLPIQKRAAEIVAEARAQQAQEGT